MNFAVQALLANAWSKGAVQTPSPTSLIFAENIVLNKGVAVTSNGTPVTNGAPK